MRKKIFYRNRFWLVLDIEDWIQENLYFLNTYEEREISFIEKQLKPGNVFIDVGANIGLFSLAASSRIGSEGKVYAFEPVKKNYEKLSLHIRLNQLKNIQAEKLALTDHQRGLNLYLDENKKNSGSATSYPASGIPPEHAPSDSLDHYLANSSIPTVSFIKMDIEGGEYAALLGMSETLKKYKPMLLIEINPGAPYGQGILENFLGELGYKKYFIADDGSLTDSRSRSDSSCNYLFC